MNPTNKDRRSPAEKGEGRPLNKENTRPSYTQPTQSGARVSPGLAGVRKAAKEHPEMKFTALLHHLTVDLLRESFYALKRKAAPGVDGVTWQEYETGLEGRLRKRASGSGRSCKATSTITRYRETSTACGPFGIG
jgi:hypothetical protein